MADLIESSTEFTEYDLNDDLNTRFMKVIEKKEYAKFYKKLCNRAKQIKEYFPYLFNYCQPYVYYSSIVEKQGLVPNVPYHVKRFILREEHNQICKFDISVFNIISELKIIGKFISTVSLNFYYQAINVEINLINCGDDVWSLPKDFDPMSMTSKLGRKSDDLYYMCVSFYVGYHDCTVFPQSYEIECFGIFVTNADSICTF